MNAQTLHDIRDRLSSTCYQLEVLGGDTKELTSYRQAVDTLEHKLNDLNTERAAVGDLRQDGAKAKLAEVDGKIQAAESELEQLLTQVAACERRVCTQAFEDRGDKYSELANAIYGYETSALKHLLAFYEDIVQAHEAKRTLHVFFQNAKRVSKQMDLYPREEREVHHVWGARWSANDIGDYLSQWLSRFRLYVVNRNFPGKGKDVLQWFALPMDDRTPR